MDEEAKHLLRQMFFTLENIDRNLAELLGRQSPQRGIQPKAKSGLRKPTKPASPTCFKDNDFGLVKPEGPQPKHKKDEPDMFGLVHPKKKPKS